MRKGRMRAHWIYRKFGKRIMDIICSTIALVLVFPLFFLVTIIIKIDTRGPAIYKQKRLGLNAKEFTIYKFRTMVVDADRIGPISTSRGDKRITRTGTILRKFSLDELPQLINILLGHMSIVGFRPGVRENYTIEELNGPIFTVKPGITGYAQIKGRSLLTRDKKREFEAQYIHDISFSTDLKIVLLTIKNVIIGKEAY